MKLYKITRFVDPETGDDRAVAGWRTSDGDASKLCTAIKKIDKALEPEREEIEVPTTRTALVEFLNTYAVPGFVDLDGSKAGS